MSICLFFCSLMGSTTGLPCSGATALTVMNSFRLLLHVQIQLLRLTVAVHI